MIQDYLDLLQEAGWDKLPKGWTKSSIKKFSKSLTGVKGKSHKGFFEKCVNKFAKKNLKIYTSNILKKL